MRIVDVCAFYTPAGGGVKTYVDRKLSGARDLGHEIVVIAPGARDAVVARGPDATLVTIASPRFPLDLGYRYFADEAKLHRVLSAWRPDFVEVSSPWASASMVGRWKGAVPRALLMHCDPLSAYAYRWFGGVADLATIDRGFERFWRHLRALDAKFDYIVCANDNLTERLRQGGVRGATTVKMGVQSDVFSPRHRDAEVRRQLLALCGLGPDATLLLGVGRYSPEKRWGMVIDAAISAGTALPLGLVLVGDGRSRPGLVVAAAGSPHVVIGRAIGDRATLAAMMASSDALVHGCEAETFCMAAAEARASGLPIIVPDRGGAADHADGFPNLRYGATNRTALRQAMTEFAHRPHAFGISGEVRATRTIDDHFRELFALYANEKLPRLMAA
jgi:alpha-1,6-mannosyltransferase